SVPALRMGSLLALPPSVDVNSMGLETDAAKILAHTFQDYGGYTVDDAAWSVYAVATEYSPSGKVDDEFGAAWNFTISPASRDVPWARDMDRIFGALNVIDNWDQAKWAQVSASNGTQGAGGGAPRVAWAPDFGPGSPDTVPPVASASLSGTTGAANWFVSRVNVTLSATDDSSGVAAIHFRTDGGAWQLYASPVAFSAEGSHSIDYYATDLAGNNESSHTATLDLDTVAPVSSAHVAVTLTATSGSGVATSIAYRIDGSAWVTYSQPFTLPDGRHVLTYQATDADGYSEVSKSSSFNVDSTPPSVLATSPGVPIGPD